MLSPTHRSSWAGLALAVLSIAAVGSPARAGFLEGQSMSVQIQDAAITPALLLGPVPFVVNDTVEVGVANTPNVGTFNLEVDDNTITFTYTQVANFSTASFNGYVFRALSALTPAFGSITVDSATTLAGFDNSRLSFDSSTFNINVSGLSAGVGTVLKLDVQPAAMVPEPSSLMLAGLGMIALGGAARARTRD